MTHAASIDAIRITPSAGIDRARHGWRAKCLQRLVRMDLPVPRSHAISAECVQRIATGNPPDLTMLAGLMGDREDTDLPASGLISVRPSALNPEWGGPGTVLNVGINDARHAALASRIGQQAADAIYLHFVQSYATHIARLDPDMFTQDGEGALHDALRTYADEMDEPFPQDPAVQLAEVLRSMARAWDGPTARLLRQAKGAPAEAPLGLVVQGMALGMGPGFCGSGTIQFVDSVTGTPRITGRFRGQMQGSVRASDAQTLYLTKDERGPSLEEVAPEVFADLVRFGVAARERLREEMQIEFVVNDGRVWIIDAVRLQRSSRASVRIAVALANDGIIPPAEAVMRVEPRALSDLLHHQVDPRAPRDLVARGINASPGAATGKIVFSATAAQASAARGEPCVLVRRETVPEDIRGMHASVAVLTERGGTTSHAAVIARGLGLPCIVGASGISIDTRTRLLRAGNRSFREGEVITIDGTTGEVLAGAAEMLEPALDDSFTQLLEWADQFRQIDVRANADTPEDARTARMFNAQGIGLCRTEHMFFDAERLPAMREMIFADKAEDRRLALERILPMQRDDFAALFQIMAGLPVTIRLFDPPLHEFLPHDRDGMRELAESLDLPLPDVMRRVDALSEFNPMLGMRGVRLGIVMPEIYDMQARAIFEATALAGRDGAAVVPEIMIPLVSAMREVELVKNRVDAVAAEVRNKMHTDFTYRLGVMVETPRAALRAGDIAAHAAFLSFGTNDLTQMTYGLSRDDAGRFMGTYVGQGVYDEDPFHILDQDGVGELLMIGAERARKVMPDITLSVCGEHGGNPESIAFCHRAAFSYVSCSPFRVPVARLAGAQESIRANYDDSGIRPPRQFPD
ncbi:pyruvate, phosphate dikinase [Paracoccus sp. M683]|uniref:putative PEP-binding protein n=1 Tax=Paracoccus sp. M683 TaxID=2594268 RepID=UPI00118126E6|nr:putative PEP-binding protein [Paracoccus sp. M683]TRW98342.1 pyruvate, phosphate dikinase [Paracoccus sp. M683]